MYKCRPLMDNSRTNTVQIRVSYFFNYVKNGVRGHVAPFADRCRTTKYVKEQVEPSDGYVFSQYPINTCV